jgi:hypothetical protein
MDSTSQPGAVDDQGSFFGLQLQPISQAHIELLTALKHKFILQMNCGRAAARAVHKAEKRRLLDMANAIELSEDDVALLVYVFTLSRLASLAGIVMPGRIRAAARELQPRLPPYPPDVFMRRLMEHYRPQLPPGDVEQVEALKNGP